MMRRLFGAGIVAALWVAAPASAQTLPPQIEAECPHAAGLAIECVRPSATDPAIQRFDSSNYVIIGEQAGSNAPLLLFLSGTGGVPPGPKAFLTAAAGAGYRVISLAYNDDVSVAIYCPTRPSPDCSTNFRAMRIYGNQKFGDAAVDNTSAESIVNRLVKLLQYLDRNHRDGSWGGYLRNGMPEWQRIAVAGQSQGAGMAAFVAKQYRIARVILFSSPWDYVERNGQRELAPWISLPSKTPPERWFGGYHARENMADLLARSYGALNIPQGHIRVFDEDLPGGLQSAPRSENPFHGQGLFNPAYAEARAFFLRTPER